MCLSTDLDFMLHMNNARYLRECDFGREFLLMRTGILRAISKRKGMCLLGEGYDLRKMLAIFIEIRIL